MSSAISTAVPQSFKKDFIAILWSHQLIAFSTRMLTLLTTQEISTVGFEVMQQTRLWDLIRIPLHFR